MASGNLFKRKGLLPFKGQGDGGSDTSPPPAEFGHGTSDGPDTGEDDDDVFMRPTIVPDFGVSPFGLESGPPGATTAGRSSQPPPNQDSASNEGVTARPPQPAPRAKEPQVPNANTFATIPAAANPRPRADAARGGASRDRARDITPIEAPPDGVHSWASHRAIHPPAQSQRPNSLGQLVGVTGVPHARALTDANGYYTLVGLPRDTDITNTSRREGFLQLALTTRTPHTGDYEQEYNGSGTNALVERAYTDDRYSYSASFQHGPFGEMAFTVINETRAPSDPGFGSVTPGTYTTNGAAGARFQILPRPRRQRCASSTAYLDGAHTDPSQSQSTGDGIPDGPVLHRQPGRRARATRSTSTSRPRSTAHGARWCPRSSLYLVDSEFPQALAHRDAVPRPGRRARPAARPLRGRDPPIATRACYATRDAWPSGNERRTRFEVAQQHDGRARAGTAACLPRMVAEVCGV